jgi:protein transport protein SEC61 subunit gamma-like protein
MGYIAKATEYVEEFAADSRRFLNKCDRPDAVEVKTIATAVVMGFVLMGFIGFAVKLVHIPINSMLLG